MVFFGSLTGDWELRLLPFAEDDREHLTTLPLGRFILSVAKQHFTSGEISDLVSSLFSIVFLIGVLNSFLLTW